MPIEDYSMNLKFCAAVLIFTSSFAYAGDEDRVRKLNSQYDAAYSERSVEKMEALLASEYQVVVDGKLETRAAAIAEFKKRALTNEAVQTTSTVDKVMLSGNLAIATGVIT